MLRRLGDPIVDVILVLVLLLAVTIRHFWEPISVTDGEIFMVFAVLVVMNTIQGWQKTKSLAGIFAKLLREGDVVYFTLSRRSWLSRRKSMWGVLGYTTPLCARIPFFVIGSTLNNFSESQIKRAVFRLGKDPDFELLEYSPPLPDKNTRASIILKMRAPDRE